MLLSRRCTLTFCHQVRKNTVSYTMSCHCRKHSDFRDIQIQEGNMRLIICEIQSDREQSSTLLFPEIFFFEKMKLAVCNSGRIKKQ